MKRVKKIEINLLTMVVALSLVLGLGCGAAWAKDSGASGAVPAAVSISGDLSDAVVTLFPEKTVYTGMSVKPIVNISINGSILKEGTDFTVSVPDINDAGIYTVNVHGLGKYSGTVTKMVSVQAADLSKAQITLVRSLTTADLNEANSAVRPEVLRAVARVIQDGVDITGHCVLSSSTVIASGGNSVTVKAEIAGGDGLNVRNSSASATSALLIDLADCDITRTEKPIFCGEEIKPPVTVTSRLTPVVLREGVDYILTYKNNINAGIGTITVRGMGKYSGLIQETFTIAAKDLNTCTVFFTNGRSTSPYTGKAVMPLVTVRDGSKTALVQNKDYIITYIGPDGSYVTNMQDAGEYKVQVSGIGNYSGKYILDFEISGTDISNYEVVLKHTKVKANASPQIPEVTAVKDGVNAMLLQDDYTVSWKDESGNPVDAPVVPGKYSVVVTGRNSYCGSTAATFEILGIQQELTVGKTSYKVYKKSKPFQIKPVCDGDGTGFVFESSNPSVASVSENGTVTVHKLGRAVITVTTRGMLLSAPASEQIYVKVYPYKVTLNGKISTSGGKKMFQVRWDTQEDVTYYQVRYSRNKSFKSGTYNTKKITQNTKGYKTQSKKITGLKSGKKYYVKVRAVTVVTNEDGEKIYYYGNWSDTKSVTVK